MIHVVTKNKLAIWFLHSVHDRSVFIYNIDITLNYASAEREFCDSEKSSVGFLDVADFSFSEISTPVVQSKSEDGRNKISFRRLKLKAMRRD